MVENNQTNKYEEFNARLDAYQPYFEGLEQAEMNRVNPNTRNLTALLTPNDKDAQLFLIDSTRSRPSDFIAPLGEKVKIEKEKLTAFLSQTSIDAVLKTATDSQLDPILEVIMPVKGVGENADKYTDISNLRLTKDAMAKVIKTRNTREMKAYTEEVYQARLNNPAILDEEKRIIQAVITASPSFVPDFYANQSELVSMTLDRDLEGQKPDYVANMLENRDTVDFMIKYRANAKKQAERDNTYI